MKKLSCSSALLFLVAAMLLSGCVESDVDKDGVPKIDVHGRAIIKKVIRVRLRSDNTPPEYVNREFRVVSVQGKDMSLEEFINTYCLGKETTNDTCVRAARIASHDRLGSSSQDEKLEPLPAGL